MAGRGSVVRRAAAVLASVALVAGCAPESAAPETAATTAPAPVSVPSHDVDPAPEPTTGPSAPPPVAAPSEAPTRVPSNGATEPPSWFRQRLLDVTATGFPAPQDAPEEYLDRRLVTPDVLPPPVDDAFAWTSVEIPPELVERSSWREGCPTTLAELRYVTVSFWGFDGLHHTGELIMHRDVVDDLRGVFAVMHETRFPLEQVALLEPVDFHEFHRNGDDNITAMYECRASTGSSRWSQHAYGRAIDINPFHNPYRKQTDEGLVVLPAYATAYVDRGDVRPGMLIEGDPVVDAFDAIGWGWGGRWRSLKDWQHFSASGA